MNKRMEASKELPSGWIKTSVGEISDKIHYGYTASARLEDIGPKLLRITDIQESKVDWDTVPNCEIDEDVIEKYLLSKNDLLFARTGATVGKSFLIKLDIPKAVFASYLIRIKLNPSIDPNLIYCYFQSSNYWRQISDSKLGIGQPNVNATILSNLSLPLPPLPEQHRIVAKLEELFTKLDVSVAELKKAKAQIKRYRQSVLKSAFEGRLTDSYSENENLPANWKLESLGKVLKTIDGDRGPNYPRKTNFFREGYCLFLMTKNVRENGFLFDENIFITKEKDEQLRGGKLILGDVVITTRGTLGNVALYDDTISYKNIRINSGMLILRIQYPALNNYYLMKFIMSPVFFAQLKKKQSGTAQPQIPANVLREIFIPLPPIDEQIQIVSEIERHFSVADATEKIIDQSLKQAERLRQSILKDAFTGKLVRQDPNDEPAEKLLERIKVSRTINIDQRNIIKKK